MGIVASDTGLVAAIALTVLIAVAAVEHHHDRTEGAPSSVLWPLVGGLAGIPLGITAALVLIPG
ncbi:hypothetical protein [Nocardiopsis changdeensis]|uniref:hypothetical protein n=1 Tax=Nocardiopsis changdeensis TaxID=2831969 RepID=UPI003F47F39E